MPAPGYRRDGRPVSDPTRIAAAASAEAAAAAATAMPPPPPRLSQGALDRMLAPPSLTAAGRQAGPPRAAEPDRLGPLLRRRGPTSLPASAVPGPQFCLLKTARPCADCDSAASSCRRGWRARQPEICHGAGAVAASRTCCTAGISWLAVVTVVTAVMMALDRGAQAPGLHAEAGTLSAGRDGHPIGPRQVSAEPQSVTAPQRSGWTAFWRVLQNPPAGSVWLGSPAQTRSRRCRQVAAAPWPGPEPLDPDKRLSRSDGPC